MGWRVAEALETLLDEVNARAPRRSKASDGSIGDAAHASRTSDHNPWIDDGDVDVVSARDFTDDPAKGHDATEFAEFLRRSRDPRIKYVIDQGRMFSSYATSSYPAWTWRPYSGSNAHIQHTHVSVQPEKRLYDSTAPWGWAAGAAPGEGMFMAIRKGDKGEHVEYWQYRANAAVPKRDRVKPDGVFGAKTARLFAKVLGKDEPVDYLGGGRMSAIEDKVLVARLRRLRGVNELDLAKLAAEVAENIDVEVNVVPKAS